MLSRVAESILWLARYIERAENVARFIDVNLHLALDQPTGAAQWEPLVNTTGDRELFEEHFEGYSQASVIQFLAFDPDYPNSILRCVHAARENARSVREVISSEMWESVNRFFLIVRAAAFGERDPMTLPHRFFTQVKMSSHTFNGITDATMAHGEAWHWAQLGRHLERADKTSRILDVKYFILLPGVEDVGTPLDNIQWASLLRSASALEMYRKRHGRIDPARVAEFLLLDRDFPRAMRHCLVKAEESLHAISGTPLHAFENPAEQRLGRLRADFDYARADEIISSGLHEFLDAFQGKLNEVGDAISETFFALPPVPEPSTRAQRQGRLERSSA